jgi:protein-disulfide isomerase
MKNISTLILTGSVLLGALSFSQITLAAADNSFNATQTKAIEQITHNYLVNNPQVIVEAMKKLQADQADKEISKIKDVLPKYKKEIFDDSSAVRATIGNPKGKVLVAEFFSYQCPNCRMMESTVDNLIKINPELKVVFVPWPFENNDDVYAAKATFAAKKQGKFAELHSALMGAPDLLTKDSIDKFVSGVAGLDVKKLQDDMNDRAIENGLKDNFKLAQDLTFSGTPVFVFTNSAMTKYSVVPGRATPEEMQKALDEVK